MKLSRLVLLLALLLPTGALAQDGPAEATVVYLLRHAETVPPPYAETPPNPPLRDVGQARAKHLARMLAHAGVTHVWSSDYRRTQETAAPLGERLGLTVASYNPRALPDVAAMLRATMGRHVVVGHSNTTPQLVQHLGGDPGTPIADAWEFDRLYIVTLGPGAQATTIQLRYGPQPTRVIMETALGNIIVEIDEARAPITATNFLRYLDEGRSDSGTFFRTVTPDNQPTDSVRIEVIQGEFEVAEDQALPPIPHETTAATGLRHLDGTLSMARSALGTASSSFFICIGDQPELDYGGRRNPDGQGFAAFGKVVVGMDVVRAIQQQAAEGQRLTTPVAITRIARLE